MSEPSKRERQSQEQISEYAARLAAAAPPPSPEVARELVALLLRPQTRTGGGIRKRVGASKTPRAAVPSSAPTRTVTYDDVVRDV